MNRVNPTRLQKLRLLEANAFRCCVCKRSSIGFNFHHIDGDSSNTADQNLALLCVEDHDEYHRPQEYKEGVKHLELMARNISRSKTSWEAFVAKAEDPSPCCLQPFHATATSRKFILCNWRYNGPMSESNTKDHFTCLTEIWIALRTKCSKSSLLLVRT